MSKGEYVNRVINGRKKCNGCRKIKLVEEFYKQGKYCHSVCKLCTNIRYKEYMKNPINKKKFNERNHLRKKVLVDLLGGKCVICGYNRCISGLMFHHINPATKSDNIAGIKNFKGRLNEIKKTILLCTNCHAEIHSGFISYPSIIDFTQKVTT